MNYKTPQERLLQFGNFLFHDLQKFVKYINLELDVLNEYLDSSKNKIITDPETLSSLKKLGLNYDWYLTGEGPMVINDNTDTESNVRYIYELGNFPPEKLVGMKLVKV